MNAALLVLGVVALLALPLLPAILELRQRRDAAELWIDGSHCGRPDAFAAGLLDAVRRSERGAAPGDPSPPASARERMLVMLKAPMTLRRDLAAGADVYCDGPVVCDRGALVRAVLAEETIALGRASRVARWAHAASIRAEPEGDFPGRLTARREIVLDAPARFRRLHAPCLFFAAPGVGRPTETEPAAPAAPTLALDRLGTVVHRQAALGRVVIAGDVDIPAGSRIEGMLVVLGRLRVGAGSVVRGDLKARRAIDLGERVVVDGAVFSEDRVLASGGCRIRGPLVGETEVRLAPQCVVGRTDWPTTVSSDRMIVEPGVLIHGTAWARSAGVLSLR